MFLNNFLSFFFVKYFIFFIIVLMRMTKFVDKNNDVEVQ